jgi:hypothetical protein
MFLRNVRWLSPDFTVIHPWRQNSSESPLFESNIINAPFTLVTYFSRHRGKRQRMIWEQGAEDRFWSKRQEETDAGDNCAVRSSIMHTLQHVLHDIWGICNTHWADGKCVHSFGGAVGKWLLVRSRRRWGIILSRVCVDYYKTGIGLTTGFIRSHTVTVYTLYNSQQLSLFSCYEDPGSSSATTAATNSYGIPCHHSLTAAAPPSNTKLLNSLTENSSQSHITTDDLSVSASWFRAPSGAHDQMLITVWQLLFCRYWAPSLTRGWVCHLS